MTGNPCAEIDLGRARRPRPDRDPDTQDGPIAAALDEIPGISDRYVHMRHDDVGRLEATVSFTAWSPSLHAVELRRTLYGMTGMVDEALFNLTPMLSSQRSRAAHAATLGVSRPMEGDDFDRIDHLWTDRTLVEMRQTDDTLLAVDGQVRTSLRNIHQIVRQHPYMGGPVLAERAGVAAELPKGRHGDVIRFAGGSVDIMPDGFLQDRRRPGGPLPSFDGLLVSIPSEPMPEIALTAMSGRPLGDLARLHPMLDGRMVDHARNSDNGKRVLAALVPDLVRLSDIHPS
jgi:hypothetical protein